MAPILTGRVSVPCNTGMAFWRGRARSRVIPGRSLGQPAIRFPGGYGGAVDGDRTQVLLLDLGGVLFGFDHRHRLNVLGECLGLPPGRVDELLWQSGFSAGCDAGRYRDAAAVRAQIRRDRKSTRLNSSHMS